MFHQPVIFHHQWEQTDEIPQGCTIHDDGIECDGDRVCYTDVSVCKRCGAFMLSDQGGDYIAVVGDTSACQHELPTIDADGTTWIIFPGLTSQGFGKPGLFDAIDANYQGGRWRWFAETELPDDILRRLSEVDGVR